MSTLNPHDWNGHVPEPEVTKRDLLERIKDVAALVRRLAGLGDEMERASQEIRNHPPRADGGCHESGHVHQ